MENERRPPYGSAALMGLAVFILYVVTLAPSTAFWDTSEYIATAHIVGIPHPPGNPLFVMLARSWSLLLAPLGLSVAVRVNLFAAATSAVASGFLFLVAHRILVPHLRDTVRAQVGSAVAVLVGATAFTVWNQSTVNEKVYTVSVAVIAAVTWLALRWRDRHEATGSERYLLVALFLLALGSTNHMMSVLPLPALGVLVILTDLRTVLRRSFLARAVPLVVLGLSFNFVLPVRAAQDPVIDEGDPTCASFVGAAEAIYTGGRAGCQALADNLTRKQYQTPPITQRKAPFGAQMKNYFQYFDWQWARGIDPSPLPGGARTPFTLLFLGLGLVGLWLAWKTDKVVAAYLLTLILTLSVALVFYLNFRYGYSLAPDQAAHEVRERDYFFIASFIVWGWLAGVGLAWSWGVVASLVGSARRYLVAAPVLLVGFMPLALNWSWASRAGDWAAHDWAYDLLMSVEPYGVLFTNGDNDTFPLWYLQEVEGIRKDVTVIVVQYLSTTWYPRQLQRLTSPARQRPFDATQASGVYDPHPPVPEHAILRVSPDSIDRIRPVRLGRDVTLTFPDLAITYPKGTVLDRTDQLVLSIIHDTVGERPVYFSSVAGVMRGMGLDRWAVRQGLSAKLMLRSLKGPQPTGLMQGKPQYGGEWFALDRSLHLYQDVYRYRSIRDRAIWQDRATLGIPMQYYAMALQLSDVAEQAGRDPETVRRLRDDALGFREVGMGGPDGGGDVERAGR